MEAIRTVCGVALLSLGLWGLYDAGLDAMDTPEVLVSAGTGECVEVWDRAAVAKGLENKWSCSHLPPRYERVLVK